MKVALIVGGVIGWGLIKAEVTPATITSEQEIIVFCDDKGKEGKKCSASCKGKKDCCKKNGAKGDKKCCKKEGAGKCSHDEKNSNSQGEVAPQENQSPSNTQ